MVRFTGGRTGFKTFRDLILFTVGLFICLFHIFTTPAPELSIKLLLFGAGLAGSPSVLRYDERYEDKIDDKVKKRRRSDMGSDED